MGSDPGRSSDIRAVTIRLVVLLTFSTLAGCRASATSGGTPPPPPSPPAPPSPGAPTVHVQGTRLADSLGQPGRLRGGNRPGAGDPCAQGWGIFDGPTV